jgi:predicted transcriptional regulator
MVTGGILMKDWTFITNHGLVLLYISQHPQCTTREMAAAMNVTERTVRRVMDDLVKEGYISWQRASAGNIYQIERESGLRHEMTRALVVGDLLHLLNYKNK